MVAVASLIIFGNLLIISRPQDALLGKVVTAIETLKEAQIHQKEMVVSLVAVSVIGLLLVYLFLRRNDVRT